MSLKNLHILKAAEAVAIENGMFIFEVDYSVREGFEGPHDYDTVLIQMAFGCLGEMVVVGKVDVSHPIYDDGGCTIGVQYIKVALADAADLK